MPTVPPMKPGVLTIERGAEPGEPYTTRITRADPVLEASQELLDQIRRNPTAEASIDGDTLTLRDSCGTVLTYRINGRTLTAHGPQTLGQQ